MMYLDKTLRVSAHRSPKGDVVLREDAQGSYGIADAEKLAADVAAAAKKHKLTLSGDFYSPHPKGYPKDGMTKDGWQFCLLRSVVRRKSDGRKFSKPTLAMLPNRQDEGEKPYSTKLL